MSRTQSRITARGYDVELPGGVIKPLEQYIEEMLPVALINYQVEDLAADGDINDRPIFVVPPGFDLEIDYSRIISQGAAAGIDAGNTCVLTLSRVRGGDVETVCTFTFNNVNPFPASGSVHNTGALHATHKLLMPGDLLRISVVNGTTANPPAFMWQITGRLLPIT